MYVKYLSIWYKKVLFNRRGIDLSRNRSPKGVQRDFFSSKLDFELRILQIQSCMMNSKCSELRIEFRIVDVPNSELDFAFSMLQIQHLTVTLDVPN